MLFCWLWLFANGAAAEKVMAGRSLTTRAEYEVKSVNSARTTPTTTRTLPEKALVRLWRGPSLQGRIMNELQSQEWQNGTYKCLARVCISYCVTAILEASVICNPAR